MKKGPLPNHKVLAMTGKPKPTGKMAKGGSVMPTKCYGGSVSRTKGKK